MNNKQIIKDFFNSSFYKNSSDLEKYLHPEVEFFWNSTIGFLHLDFDKFKSKVKEMGKSYNNLVCEFTHLIAENNQVSARFTYFADIIENPGTEIPLAHFMVMAEIKEEKIHKMYIISQLDDDSPENMTSFFSKNE
ncbi:nuclear transport factor 2 family protein [Mesonia sp. K7]|uniref:nuclear transport factor 2 family protein n=1 Tax=Mesonia sp. K7 TaxID=2218606 RepID=UPI000DAA617D|nr:nuclear transport factor 2 family protein [Mesonia sp. K7]PZD78192.1 nuclear transport factor 2 family protein [Mesonia sp. K7]